MNESPLEVWCLIHSDGSVETAHCTCMAGMGAVCSHVGALLYALEFIHSSREATSCTDVLSQWNVPGTFRVEPQPLRHMEFGSVIPSSQISDIPPITENELVDTLKQIQSAGSSSCLMRLIEPFASELAFLHENLVQNIYKTIYQEEYISCSYDELLQLAGAYSDINITQQECDLISEHTREQFLSMWKNYSIEIKTGLQNVSRKSIIIFD